MNENAKVKKFLFLFICIGILAVWLKLLPMLTLQPSIAARIERLESKGIDPSAMFYTDLDAMEDVSFRLEQKKNRHPQALWIPE